MSDLTNKKCIPCEGTDIKPFTREQLEGYLLNAPKWKLSEKAISISREFQFKNFVQAVDFIAGPVADIAEGEGHHPDIHIFYNKVVLELWTHAIGGLSENDFIVAAKIDAIFP